MKSTPSHCPKCCTGLVETPDGRVPNWYSRLVFATDPPEQKCPNCGSILIPVSEREQPLAEAA